MAPLLYYLILKPFSWLPFPVLYAFSDLLYLLLYRLVGYRKEVVRSNLKRSFPEKSRAELRTIERRFYQHLCDLIVESIKAFSLSRQQLLQRAKFRNPEVLQPYFDRGQSVVIASGHYNSWELAAAGSHLQMAHQAVGIYAPIKQPFLNRRILASRQRHGMRMVAIKELKSWVDNYQGVPMALLFATDQSPRRVKTAYWTQFLGQATGVMMGTEVYARRLDWPVFWGRVEKVKRGHYEFSCELITDQPKAWAEGEITEQHVRRLEADICREPAYWLWSHKRWKHQRPEDQAV